MKRITSWLLILVLLLLALPASASTQAVSYAQVPITTSRTVPVFEELLSSSSSELKSPSAIKDFGGNAFESWVRVAGNDTRIVMQKRNPQGVVVARHDVLASGSRKIRDATIFLDGRDVAVRDTAYDLTAGTRINAYEVGRWPDVAVPYPNGVNPAGGAGASTYEAEQATEVDYDRIIDGVADEVMARLLEQYRGGELRQITEDKVKDGIGEGYDPARYDIDARSRYIQDAAAPWVRDRAYQGATSALSDYRACRAP